jgi:peptidoglycan/LPS O-acetylase OafA/YrhL
MTARTEHTAGVPAQLAAKRVRGLDALRFWCAAWVVFSHFGFLPLLGGIDLTHITGRLTRAVYANLISGPAAVIVFFVISGFCIHFPFRHETKVPLAPFYARRYLRILIPVFAAIALAYPVGVKINLFDRTVLWSLVCEEIYYGIYPLLLLLRARFGWRRLIAVSYIVSVGVALTNLPGGDYPSFGPQANWLLGLPCWLLGCDLAESYSPGTQKARRPAIGWWRVGAWILSMIASVLRFHSPITYPLTLNVLAFYIYFWLRAEIAHAEGQESGWFERAGVLSYSIYLVHPILSAIWARIAPHSLGAGVDWIVAMTFVFVASLVFFFLVERPSHRFARRTYNWLRRPATRAPVGL